MREREGARDGVGAVDRRALQCHLRRRINMHACGCTENATVAWNSHERHQHDTPKSHTLTHVPFSLSCCTQHRIRLRLGGFQPHLEARPNCTH